MKEPQEPMSDEELLTLVRSEISRAKDFTLGQIGNERSTAYDYYYGRKFGNEVAGRSQIISHDVAQQVDSAVPALLKFFVGSDKAVEFTARKAEDVEPSEQATEVCNYVFYVQNNGFLLMHDAIKNALLQKTACFKWYWDESVTVEEETYYRQTQDMVAMLLQDPGVEIIGYSQSEVEFNGQPFEFFDIKVRKKRDAGRVKVCVVPPDELLVGENAAGMEADDIPCVTHRSEKTLSELIQMGYSREEVEGLTSDEGGDSYERQSRQERTGDFHGSDDKADPMMRKVWYCETYIKVDFDRDGIAERRKVCSVGQKLLHNEVASSVPMSFGTCKIMPHEFYGISMADETMDLQLRKSSLLRLAQDNLHLSITPRTVVDTTRITNLDDVLTVRMGGVIRSSGEASGAIQPIVVPFVGQQVFPMIEYIDAEEETRTGVSRLMQGVDPNTLNKTATGVNALMNAAQARLELVARGLAETLVKPMFKGVMELLSKHQDAAQKLTIRLRNSYVPIDPRVWETEYDMTVNVGLGTGTKDQQMAHLTNLMQIQAQIFMSPMGQLFDPLELYQNIYNAASKLAENAGFKDPTKFLPDPQKAKPPQPQKPPEIQKAEMQIQADQQKQQAAMQMEQMKAGAQLQLEREKAQMQAELEKFKAELKAQTELKIAEMEARLQAELKRYEIEMRSQVQAQVGLAQAVHQPEQRPQ